MFTRADKNKDGKLTQEVTYQLNLIKWKYKYKYKQAKQQIETKEVKGILIYILYIYYINN